MSAKAQEEEWSVTWNEAATESSQSYSRPFCEIHETYPMSSYFSFPSSRSRFRESFTFRCRKGDDSEREKGDDEEDERSRQR